MIFSKLELRYYGVRLLLPSAKSVRGISELFEVYNKMLNVIRQIDFNVALIGAGAYGFPLQ